MINPVAASLRDAWPLQQALAARHGPRVSDHGLPGHSSQGAATFNRSASLTSAFQFSVSIMIPSANRF